MTVMEKTSLKLGFVPLCDSAPLIVAKERGFFAEQGLSVELSVEPSWSNIRDKLVYGLLDAAQMLATMPLSCHLGLGNVQAALVVPMGLSRGGNAITLEHGLSVERPSVECLGQGAEPPTLAMVYPFSPHHYELRYWLAEQGVDPDRDVRLTVVPPPQMVAQLAAGNIAGFCVGEPWNGLAVQMGLGRVVARAAEIGPERIEKVLGLRQDWADRHPETLAAMLRALLAACRWIDAPENRAETAEILAQPGYVNAPLEVVRAGLEDIRFHGVMPNLPDPAQAVWYLEQMARWGHLPPQTDIPAVVKAVYRPDLYRRLCEQ